MNDNELKLEEMKIYIQFMQNQEKLTANRFSGLTTLSSLITTVLIAIFILALSNPSFFKVGLFLIAICSLISSMIWVMWYSMISRSTNYFLIYVKKIKDLQKELKMEILIPNPSFKGLAKIKARILLKIFLWAGILVYSSIFIASISAFIIINA